MGHPARHLTRGDWVSTKWDSIHKYSTSPRQVLCLCYAFPDNIFSRMSRGKFVCALAPYMSQSIQREFIWIGTTSSGKQGPSTILVMLNSWIWMKSEASSQAQNKFMWDQASERWNRG